MSIILSTLHSPTYSNWILVSPIGISGIQWYPVTFFIHIFYTVRNKSGWNNYQIYPQNPQNPPRLNILFLFGLTGITGLTGRHVNAQIKVFHLAGIEHSTSASPDVQNGKHNSSATEPIKSTVHLLTLLLTKVSFHTE